MIAVRLVAETGQGLQHGHIGFARAILLDTLAATDSDGVLLTNRIKEGSDKHGLADPGLARDEYDSTLHLTHVGKPAAQWLKRGFPADNNRHRARRTRRRL